MEGRPPKRQMFAPSVALASAASASSMRVCMNADPAPIGTHVGVVAVSIQSVLLSV
jgi:hypothetical protein